MFDRKKLTVLLAAGLTLLLGPGAGHLILKEWKKAIFFISLAMALFSIIAINFISEVGRDAIMAVANMQGVPDMGQFKELYYKFQDENPKMILFFDVTLSALWAYSIVDIFITAKIKGMFKKDAQKEDDNDENNNEN